MITASVNSGKRAEAERERAGSVKERIGAIAPAALPLA
jgi:hypothetical protein